VVVRGDRLGRTLGSLRKISANCGEQIAYLHIMSACGQREEGKDAYLTDLVLP